VGLAALVAGVLVAGCWLVSLPKRDASIVDPLWPMIFVATAWSLWLWGDGAGGGRAWLMLVMVSAWGLRLGAHLTARKRGAPEDFRYQALRRRLEPFWLWSLLVVFVLQGGLTVVVSLPVQAVLGDPDPRRLGWLDLAGAAVWAVGLVLESVSDEQLRRFKADAANRGCVMDRGLWRYSRHPNYFGDSVVWWGIWAVAAAAGAWWTVAGPLLMTVLLVKVSGVSLLERSIGKRRPGYAGYVARTSAFVPRPPRRAVD
jgi:steroid 5-alpha reductase family enzyme